MIGNPPCIVRPYAPADRTAVREISCDTADQGRPVERFFHDRQLVADLLTLYYTDVDFRAVWVAELNGSIIGYLTGAFDTRHYQRVMAFQIVPGAFFRSFFRGVLFHVDTWRMIGAGLMTWRRGGHRRRIPLDDYPAHLHINLREGYRGQRLGSLLMEKFIEQVRAVGVDGVHAVVRGDNLPICRFFERMGFTPLGRQRVVSLEGKRFQEHETVVYGKRL